MRDKMSFQRASWRKASDRDVAAQLAVDPFDQIEVESRSHALAVVIGGEQSLDRLHPVHADQQLCIAAEQVAEAAQQIGRGARNEISNGRPGEKAELGERRNAVRKLERSREIGNDGLDRNRRETLGDLGRAVAKVIARNVDGDVGRGPDRLEKQGCLGRRSRAELDNRCSCPDLLGDFGQDLLEKRRFGPRRIVSRKARDLVEQLRTAAVVEPARRHGGNGRRQPSQHVLAERGIDLLSCL